MSTSPSSVGAGVFKRMQPVPPAKSFLDIVLSRTMRKTPTVVHKGYPIVRIRSFYMHKVKYTRDTFVEKLDEILVDFPRLEDIHPFYADLANVLYDRDHYKIALGQLNIAKNLISRVCSDYVKLLKYGDSLFRCKSLKKAALGRMATILKRQKSSLEYLEQVRQHMSRLPSIDPSSRTLLLCGYPNVGKSSFMNCVTKAHVEVQSYAFTTKALYVGHFDYQLLRWQVIDTPGVLDHPLEERNTIEMQAITALAHIRACVLFFMDVSETCGYGIEQQIRLFESLKPLFSGKPVLVVLNKIDLVRPEQISEHDKSLLQTTFLDNGVTIAGASCVSQEGVFEVRNAACDQLLTLRVQQKIQGQRINDILNRLHLAMPKTRDAVARPPHVPPAALARQQRRKEADALGVPIDVVRDKPLLRDRELQNGGPGVFSVDLREEYRLREETWRQDVQPEILDGHNVADYLDLDIDTKLQSLLAEDATFDYDESFLDLTPDQRVMLGKHRQLEGERMLSVQRHFAVKGHNRRPVIVDRLKQRLPSAKERQNRQTSKQRVLNRRQPRSDKSRAGLANESSVQETQRLKRTAQKEPNLHAKRGEADREITVSKPKWLYAGKRKLGSTRSR